VAARIWLILAAVVVATALLAWAFNVAGVRVRLARWNYWRKHRETGTRGSVFRGVLGGIEEFIHPEVRHVKEDKDQRQTEVDDREGSDK
jgi:hypothetical protein